MGCLLSNTRIQRQGCWPFNKVVSEVCVKEEVFVILDSRFRSIPPFRPIKRPDLACKPMGLTGWAGPLESPAGTTFFVRPVLGLCGMP